MIRVAILSICSLLLACDKAEETQASSTTRKSIAIPEANFEGVSLKSARVVGYRFALPGDDNQGAVMESGFSLITRDGALDIAALEDLEVKQAILTPDQVTRLVDAVYGVHEETGAAACYDPHHIFLFYDSSDTLFHVIEVCFGCTNLHAQPKIAESQRWRHDFRELARICEETGIGMASGTAEDQIRLWDERDQF